jgi:hypothetical protein
MLGYMKDTIDIALKVSVVLIHGYFKFLTICFMVCPKKSLSSR